MALRTVLVIGALAGCGDRIDAPVTPCEPSETYPTAIEAQEIRFGGPRALTFDGQGTHCEQVMRAVVHDTPELAALGGAAMTGTCQPDGATGREIVRMNPTTYDGQPLIQPTPVNTLRRPDVLAHVQGTMLVYLAGTLWAAGAAPDAGCLAESDVLRTVPDRSMTYLRFSACRPQGTAEYAIAPGDEIMTGDAGLFLDPEGHLRWGNAVDVYLKRTHVTPELINSDAYCCPPGMLDHCVGQRLLIDTHTGELVAQEPHCRTC